jgi:sorbitol-specific phosphotransferase system component IIC
MNYLMEVLAKERIERLRQEAARPPIARVGVA